MASQVILKLETLEPVLKSLINSPTPILKDKLEQVEKLVMQLPNDSNGVTDKWRRQLAYWWSAYAASLFFTANREPSFYDEFLNLPKWRPLKSILKKTNSCPSQSAVMPSKRPLSPNTESTPSPTFSSPERPKSSASNTVPAMTSKRNDNHVHKFRKSEKSSIQWSNPLTNIVTIDQLSPPNKRSVPPDYWTRESCPSKETFRPVQQVTTSTVSSPATIAKSNTSTQKAVCYYCKATDGHYVRTCPSLQKIICDYCKKKGHKFRFCPLFKASAK